jgi:AraC-like DNA-binding protein
MGIPLRPLAVTARTRSSYREFVPPPALVDVVACGWHGHTGWARPLRVLPDGCADLVWDGDALTVVVTAGASLRLWVPASASRVGVRLRCGAAGAVLGTPMAELPAGATRLSDVWGAPARRAEEVLSANEDPLVQREVLETLVASRGVSPDRRVLAAVHALGGPGTRTTDVAGDLGVSERALRRHLVHAVGAGPKQLHRIRRFQRFLRRLEPLAARRTSLAAVAADLGYADQSHLGRDCRRLSGSSPAALVRVAEKFQTPSATGHEDPGHDLSRHDRGAR